MSVDNIDKKTLILPSIEPVHSYGSKKSSMKKKLSKIALSLSSNDNNNNNNNNHTNNIIITSPDLTANTDIPNDIPQENLMNDFKLGIFNQPQPQLQKNKSISSLSSNSNQQYEPHNKFSKSTSNLINPKFLHKSSRSDSSSSLSSTFSQIPPPSSVPISRSGSFNNTLISTVPNKQNNFIYSSPNKSHARYLATSNDHTFMLHQNPNSNLNSNSNANANSNINPNTNIILQAPNASNGRQSHSASASINYSNDFETNLSKSIPPSTLPQFISVNNNTHNTTVLAPPTVLVPIYKTTSTSAQSSSQQSMNSISTPNSNGNSNPNSLLTANLNTTSNSASLVPSSQANLINDSTRHKRGLLQTAYRTSHRPSYSSLQTSKSKDKDYFSLDDKDNLQRDESIYTTEFSNQSKSLINSSQYGFPSSTNNNKSNDDLKIHLISPKIINEFISLQKSIQLGMKKRLEYVDKENGSLIAEINLAYDKMENIYSQLLLQKKDLDTYLENLSNKKDTDIHNLHQDALFENLNDLTTRINTVKENMTLNKDTMKQFDTKLKALDNFKLNTEARNKNIKQSFVMISCALVCFFALKSYFF
jgi:hypothetical protein